MDDSSQLLTLIEEAIESSIECSDFYDSLSTHNENAVIQLAVLEKQLEVGRGRLEDSCKVVQKLSSQLEEEVSVKEESLRKAEKLSQGLENEARVKEEALRKVEELSRRLEDEVSIKEEGHRHLEVLSEQLTNAEEEACLSIAQLHQVQEELEYYVLLSKEQSKMLEKCASLQERTAVLLANINR